MLIRAPLRISLFGGGTDLPEYYENHGIGRCLSITIDRYAWLRMERGFHDETHIFSANTGATYHTTANYLRNAFEHFYPRHGHRVYVSVDAPMNSGLGSSSAIVTAMAASKDDFNRTGKRLKVQEIAEMAFECETQHCGARIGKQDHYSAAYGGINLFEFESREVRVDHLWTQMPPEHVRLLGDHLSLVYLRRESPNASRALHTQAHRTLTGHPPTIDALRSISSAALEGASFVQAGRMRLLGELLNDAWQRKRSLGASNTKIDKLLAIARNSGALGGKVCGAGGGGFVMLLTPPDARESVQAAVYNALGLLVEYPRIEISGVRVLEGR